VSEVKPGQVGLLAVLLHPLFVGPVGLHQNTSKNISTLFYFAYFLLSSSHKFFPNRLFGVIL
jgi:hypothetical protein